MTGLAPPKKGRRKRYPLDQCPFYKLESKDRLAEILGFKLASLQELASSDDTYKVFTIAEKRDITGRVRKTRPAQQPKDELAKVHKRIYALLCRIEVPDYLHSAVRGRSYISNARQHVGMNKVVKLDIRSFYPSTKRHHVFAFFRNQMHCSEDAAALLSRLCTWKGVLPTGSQISAHLAYFCHSSMFDEIALFSERRGLTFTVYVDDMVFSGSNANRAVVNLVEQVVQRHHLSIRMDKCRVFHAEASKVITGVVVVPEGIRVPFERQKKVRLLEQLLLTKKGTIQRRPVLESLVGVLGEASQIEPRFREKLAKHAANLRIARQHASHSSITTAVAKKSLKTDGSV